MNIFNDIDLTAKAINASMIKKNVIAENISNVDTPGYKRKDVEFESMLVKKMEKDNIDHREIRNIEPKIYVDNSSSAYRLDGNNVDIDIEMAQDAKVSARYEALITRVNSQLGRFKTVLQGIK